VPARVKSGSRVRALAVMTAARVKSGSLVKVVHVRAAQVVVRVENGSRVKVVLEMIVDLVVRVGRVVSGSRVRAPVAMIAVQVVARVVSGSRVKALVAMIAAQVVDLAVMTVVMTVAKTCRKPKRSVVARKCLLAKAPVSTARTSPLVTAQIAKSESSTKVRCVAASSTTIVARRATRRAVALAPSRALSVAMTARCFPPRQPCKSHWPAKFVVQSETVATTR
jgi:hypothetical protein